MGGKRRLCGEGRTLKNPSDDTRNTLRFWTRTGKQVTLHLAEESHAPGTAAGRCLGLPPPRTSGASWGRDVGLWAPQTRHHVPNTPSLQPQPFHHGQVVEESHLLDSCSKKLSPRRVCSELETKPRSEISGLPRKQQTCPRCRHSEAPRDAHGRRAASSSSRSRTAQLWTRSPASGGFTATANPAGGAAGRRTGRRDRHTGGGPPAPPREPHPHHCAQGAAVERKGNQSYFWSLVLLFSIPTHNQAETRCQELDFYRPRETERPLGRACRGTGSSRRQNVASTT